MFNYVLNRFDLWFDNFLILFQSPKFGRKSKSAVVESTRTIQVIYNLYHSGLKYPNTGTKYDTVG